MGNTTVNVDVNTVSLTRDNYLIMLDAAISACEVFAKRHQHEIDKWKQDGAARNETLIKFLKSRATLYYSAPWDEFEVDHRPNIFVRLLDGLWSSPTVKKYDSAYSYLLNEDPVEYERFLRKYQLDIDFGKLAPWEALARMNWHYRAFVENAFRTQAEELREANKGIVRGTDAVFNIPRAEYDKYASYTVMAEDPNGGHPHVWEPSPYGFDRD